MTCAARPSNRCAVDGADPADHAVGGRALDQLVDGTATALRGDHDRAVLDERAVVDEIGDVLAGRAAADLATPLGDRVGPVRRRARRRDEPCDLGEVGPHIRGVRRRPRRRPPRWRTTPGSTEATASPAITVCPTSTRIASDRAVARRFDRVVHLHRLDQHQLLPGHARCHQRTTSIVTIVPCIGASTDCLPHAPDGSCARREYGLLSVSDASGDPGCRSHAVESPVPTRSSSRLAATPSSISSTTTSRSARR